MDWPLIRFLLLILCLVGTGVALGYTIVTNPEWQVADEQKSSIKLSRRN